jgi:hypothetical protein
MNMICECRPGTGLVGFAGALPDTGRFLVRSVKHRWHIISDGRLAIPHTSQIFFSVISLPNYLHIFIFYLPFW